MAGETVLIVDDRDDSLSFLREYVLEPNGYQVIEAHNGVEAMQTVRSQHVDLIISDLVMPKMGGLELLESLRQNGLDTPAILMTFHGSEGTAVRAFRLGARDYIIKPFTIEEMLSAVDHALTLSRLRRERDNLTKTVLSVNQQLEARVQELRVLYGIGRSVTSLTDLEQILNRIVEAAVYLTGAEEGSLMLIEPEDGALHLRAARGMGEKHARNFRIKIEDSIAGQVIQTGRPIMIGGINSDDSYRVATGYLVRALLNVPLKKQNNVIGVLAVNNKIRVQPFSERHLNLLMAMGDYATIAIQNAQFYAQLTSDVNRAEQSSRELEKMVSAQTAELDAAQQQLLKTEKLAALGYMATGVARGLETPINAILHNMGQVEAVAPSNPTLNKIKQDTQQCQKIVQKLLDFSGERMLQRQESDLNQLIERVWTTYRDEYLIYDTIEFVAGLDPHLPAAMLDGNQIEQALLNLIRHSCQSMVKGGTLRATTRSVGTHLQLIISDTGIGLSQRDLGHIFDPFYQINGYANGLDLSIAQAVIRRHAGTIEVESLPDQGTTFTIHLPLR